MPPCELPQRSQGRKAAAWDTAVSETGNIGLGKNTGSFPHRVLEIGFYYSSWLNMRFITRTSMGVDDPQTVSRLKRELAIARLEPS